MNRKIFELMLAEESRNHPWNHLVWAFVKIQKLKADWTLRFGLLY